MKKPRVNEEDGRVEVRLGSIIIDITHDPDGGSVRVYRDGADELIGEEQHFSYEA